MEFSTNQDKARNKTFWLALLYIMGVLLLALVAVLVINAILAWGYPEHPQAAPKDLNQYVEMTVAELGDTVMSQRFAGILAGLAGFLAFASGYKYMSLRTGGKNVAQSLGARLVTAESTDPDERRLLNIVEEMAIASGVPVPPVYLLAEEPGINAFAAGYTINDAVIGVTRGTISHLDREELQAVVAHEFSHIFNGDMRLNLRFTSVLFGLLCLVQIARLCLRLSARGSRGGGSDRNKALLVWLAVSITLFITGMLMAFWGRVMQAAINRQREYLADASAVQFTRSLALASALKKIGGASGLGSELTDLKDTSYNHFFLCKVDNGLLSTHPPLAQRILRLDPSWDGQYTMPVRPRENSAAPAKETDRDGGKGARLSKAALSWDVLTKHGTQSETANKEDVPTKRQP